MFLEALPTLLGNENLSHVVYIMSDGGSQEFNVTDEGNDMYFDNARRGRCTFHIVQKAWETVFPKSSNGCFRDPHRSKPLTKAIKQWMYSWMTGCGSYSEAQYNVLKEMLSHASMYSKQIQVC